MSLESLCTGELDAIRRRGTYRALRTLEGPQGTRTVIEGKEVLLFAGSNYLDLAHHPEVVEASVRTARSHGCAAGGSRLISGNLSLHDRLEEGIAAHLGTETALVFATGYMANVGLIPALAGPGDVIVSDALNHASIIDGCRLSRAEVRVFAHGDLGRLETELADSARPGRRLLLVADGVYSMDGDVAPLAEMVALARRFGALVVLDDAHGTGTLGPRGRGTAELAGRRGWSRRHRRNPRQSPRILRRVRRGNPHPQGPPRQRCAQLHLLLRPRTAPGGGRSGGARARGAGALAA